MLKTLTFSEDASNKLTQQLPEAQESTDQTN